MPSKPVSPRFALLLLGLLTLSVCGCGYGEVSPEAYDYAKALYGLAGRRAADKIDQFAERLDRAESDRELPAHEVRWLRSILEDARQGDWTDAMQSARQMMEDQVRH